MQSCTRFHPCTADRPKGGDSLIPAGREIAASGLHSANENYKAGDSADSPERGDRGRIVRLRHRFELFVGDIADTKGSFGLTIGV